MASDTKEPVSSVINSEIVVERNLEHCISTTFVSSRAPISKHTIEEPDYVVLNKKIKREPETLEGFDSAPDLNTQSNVSGDHSASTSSIGLKLLKINKRE